MERQTNELKRKNQLLRHNMKKVSRCQYITGTNLAQFPGIIWAKLKVLRTLEEADILLVFDSMLTIESNFRINYQEIIFFRY